MDQARIAVITFPGSNDDGDARLALEALGAVALPVWHMETQLPAESAASSCPGASRTATTSAAGRSPAPRP